MSASIHQGYLPGCIGRVTELHANYYSERAGFGVAFEAKVGRELAEFCGRYDEQRDGLWLVTADGGMHGAVVIDGLHAQGEGAHLRWFIASSEVRGTGLGNSLLSSALEFCERRDYRRVYLWTFEGLDAARHLYEKFGFALVQQQRGSRWGRDVNEQRFERRV